MHPAAESWQDALERLDQWFADVRARLPGVIPCRPGCSACCYGPFDISVADALLLREGLAGLPTADREEVRKRARALFTRMREQTPDWEAPWDVAQLGEDRFDVLADRFSAEPCPLLDPNGHCRVYTYRPLVCRLIGLPMMTAGGLALENACPIQDRFPVYASLDPQLFDLEALEAEETACAEGAAMALFDSPLHRGFETTIAAVAAD
jgi:Fe-S-cluster containining protein